MNDREERGKQRREEVARERERKPAEGGGT